MGQREIYEFMNANRGIWFNLDQISELCIMNRVQTIKCLSKMMKYPGIFEGLDKKEEKVKRERGTYAITYYRVDINECI